MNLETFLTATLNPGFCLIRPIEQEFSKLLVKPDRVDARQGYGEVLNARDSIGFTPGDFVIYDRVRGAEIDVEGGLNYVRNADVLCVVE
jgi:hypothetical protein